MINEEENGRKKTLLLQEITQSGPKKDDYQPELAKKLHNQLHEILEAQPSRQTRKSHKRSIKHTKKP